MACHDVSATGDVFSLCYGLCLVDCLFIVGINTLSIYTVSGSSFLLGKFVYLCD